MGIHRDFPLSAELRRLLANPLEESEGNEMEEFEKSNSNTAAIVGIVGVASSVLGIADLPIEVRLICLMIASVCFPLSFYHQAEWPMWIRWTLTLLVDAFLAYVGWSAYRAL